MKKIFNILLSATALLAFAPALHAQGDYSIAKQIPGLEWPKDNGVHKATDFAYSKDISAPQSDGTYWIKLESFSTGVASYVQAAAPADIVLVLDLSSSMVNNGIPVATPQGGWTYNNAGGGYHYQYNNALYEVEPYTNNGRYYLRFNTGNNNYRYLTGNTNQRNAPGNAPQNANAAIFTGTLYGESRLEALKRATNDFIDVIEKNDKFEDDGVTEREGRLGNRISIVTFWSQMNLITSLQKGQLADESDATHSTAAELKALVTNFTNGSGTRPDLGIAEANNQFTQYVDEARKLAASRTVVVFTDGEPYANGITTNTLYDYGVKAAEVSKKTHGATVFTVGLFSSTPTSGSDLYKFMNLMSSNAPDASSFSDTDFTDKGFYKDASAANADLSKVFTEIAHQSGGSTTTLSAASSNVDVVSNSFMLPEGTDTDNIQNIVKIFVAKLNTIQNEEYKFDEEVLIGHLPDDYVYYELDEHGERVSETPIAVDATIGVAYEDPNKIKVTGFDYSSNFCGPVYQEGWDPAVHTAAENAEHVHHYQGYKIIIMIPIKMNPDAVGGPDIKTNGPGSGIFITDEDLTAFVAYESPTVSLPVNIHITKSGLKPGESAKFRIERATLPTSGPVVYNNLTWNYVTTVFVTRPQNAKDSDPDPVTYIRGLPANQDVTVGEGDDATTEHRSFVYRISEENWSWSYDSQTAPKYTDTDYIDNPFEFANKPKDNIDVKVRHAESKATNIFKPGVVTGNVKYDDSKKNTGTGRGE